MKLRVLTIVILSFLLLEACVVPAFGQSLPPCPGTNGVTGTITLSPSEGAPGSSFQATAAGSYASDTIYLYWQGTDVWGSPRATITTDGSGNGSTTVTVPSDATLGSHDLMAFVGSYESISCFPFTVVAAVQTVQTDAYPVAAVTSLPNTGLFLLIPAAGLGAAGIGTILVRRRSR